MLFRLIVDSLPVGMSGYLSLWSTGNWIRVNLSHAQCDGWMESFQMYFLSEKKKSMYYAHTQSVNPIWDIRIDPGKKKDWNSK